MPNGHNNLVLNELANIDFVFLELDVSTLVSLKVENNHVHKRRSKCKIFLFFFSNQVQMLTDCLHISN